MLDVEEETLGQVRVDDSETLSADARLLRWQGRRPNIDHLSKAIFQAKTSRFPGDTDGDLKYVPLFDVGDRIVVDRRTPLLKGEPWLETIVGKVRTIDDDTGIVSVWDEASNQANPMTRWLSFTDGYHIFKLCPAKGDPFEVPLVKPTATIEKTPNVDADGNPQIKRHRGRPKGSKNRSKEIVKAEKAARKAKKSGS